MADLRESGSKWGAKMGQQKAAADHAERTENGVERLRLELVQRWRFDRAPTWTAQVIETDVYRRHSQPESSDALASW